MKPLLFLSFCLFTHSIAYANAAVPGIWSAGGVGTFSLLYPEDSSRYKTIQMVREKVSIELYKGYAVVKGEYWMYNHSPNSTTIRVGYPLNSDYKYWTENEQKISIHFDTLYELKGFSNKKLQRIISKPIQNPIDTFENNNWYIWENNFNAKDTTFIEVYFIVNTNETIISEGYNRDNRNGFIYVLESGATWKQPIIKGEVRIRLMDNITIDDIKGIFPSSIFKVGQDVIFTEFYNLTPNSLNNIIIAYTDKVIGFDFAKIICQDDKLYKSVNDFSTFKINPTILKSYDFNDPFHVHSSFSGFIVGLIWILYITWIPLVIIITIFVFIKIWPKKKKNVA